MQLTKRHARKVGRPLGGSKSIAELFWVKVDKSKGQGPTGTCWQWTASKHKTKNRGCFHINGKSIEAHRASWLINKGLIPSDLSVLHTCDNPSCVRPTHLFLGTQADNMKDMVQKGRHGKPLAKRSHCKNGHEFTPDNTRLRKQNGSTHRQCIVCIQITNKKWRNNATNN